MAVAEGDRVAEAVSFEVDNPRFSGQRPVEIRLDASEAGLVAPDEAKQRGGKITLWVDPPARRRENHSRESKRFNLATGFVGDVSRHHRVALTRLNCTGEIGLLRA